MTCTMHVFEDGRRGILCRRGEPKPRLPVPPHPDNRPGFPLGQVVEHDVYGRGVVLVRHHADVIAEDTADVRFAAGGTKTFVVSLATAKMRPANPA